MLKKGKKKMIELNMRKRPKKKLSWQHCPRVLNHQQRKRRNPK